MMSADAADLLKVINYKLTDFSQKVASAVNVKVIEDKVVGSFLL
jgi:hypothetical protein